jgi:crossover junction endodeoxyribonuclease RuvC
MTTVLPSDRVGRMSVSLRVLGIDPGFDRMGFGLIEQKGSTATHLTHGVVQTSKSMTFAERLLMTRDELKKLLTMHAPDRVIVEQLFFQNNAKTAINVAMARGVTIVTIAETGIPVFELTPNQVKQGITGHGAADKKQVQAMVQRILNLKEIPKPDDAADALAIAIVGGLLPDRSILR